MSTIIPGPGMSRLPTPTVTPSPPERRCAACGAGSNGKRAIHRDGFGEGPEVWLCKPCGYYEQPSCEMLWARIAGRMPLDAACYCDPSGASP